MKSAKISANELITVPVQAIYKAQKAFTGVAEELRVYNEDDVQELVNEVRYEKDI